MSAPISFDPSPYTLPELLERFDQEYSFSKHLLTIYSIAIGLKAKRIVDIGIGSTTKALRLAASRTGGTVFSCDADKKRFSDLLSQQDEHWRLFLGNSDLFLEEIAPPFDLVVHDGAHDYRQVRRDLQLILPKMRTFGLICIHDTQQPNLAQGMLAAIRDAAAGWSISLTNLPYGAGLAIIRVESGAHPAISPEGGMLTDGMFDTLPVSFPLVFPDSSKFTESDNSLQRWIRGKIKWRSSLLSEKIRGHLPDAAWRDILNLLIPCFIVSKSLAESIPLRELYRDQSNCPVLWGTMLGSFWGRETDREALSFVACEQLFEIYQQGPVRIRPGDVVFDVGGHVGVFTRVALNNGASKVVIFEPESTNTACLEKTFEGEIKSGQVILVKAAAWNEKKVLKFSGNAFTFRHAPAADTANSVTASATTIDAIAEELGLDRVNFIKMDIEGSERYALQGAEAVLAKYAPRLAISSYHLPDDREALPRVILDAQPAYRTYCSPDHAECIYFYRD